MKNIVYIFLVLSASITIQAQQIRYVDTGYILDKVPQYQQAKQKLESQVNAWKSEIEKGQTAIDKLEMSLENERVILTEEKILEKEEEITEAKQKLTQKIEQKFGIKGESVSLRQNLVKPIQDQIWNAINTISKKNRYDLVIDKNSGTTLIYSNSKYDITDAVIKELGLDKPQETKAVKPVSRNTKTTQGVNPQQLNVKEGQKVQQESNKKSK